MTEIKKAGEDFSLGDLDTPQGEFRKQIDALTDAVRQLGGNPQVAPGSFVVNDPLNAPYVLYVNGYTGEDTFVSGQYASADDGTFEQKMRRISQQRLECGYTEARPFKTINRAIIEAGIITSYDYLNLTPAPCGDLVSIVVAPGAHTCLNGTTSTEVKEWSDGYEPTDNQLLAFNPSGVGGIILPRGCSLISLDLRKTIIRPDSVPAPAAELSDYSNRRAMLRVTGGCYVYGMTFMDKVGFNQSHHLLDVFQYASKAQLDEFYAKIRAAFPASTGVDPSYAVTRTGEYQIVGPQPAVSSNPTDTVGSASPYLYNISNRSVYGMGGLFANGAEVEGFKSCVIAQYTGVSLQRDMSSWQIYKDETWREVANYNEYINADPNDLRHNPERRSYHIRAVNRAVIQEVSVFAIGQAIHHAVESGGEITVTNSNSNWGGCAALATGFHDLPNPIDVGHTISEVIAPLDPISNATVRKIPLGALASGQEDDTTVLKFNDEGVDNLFLDAGYTLPANDLVWVTNPYGDDFYGEVVSYNLESSPQKINIDDELRTAAGETIQDILELQFGNEIAVDDFLNDQQVYIRRLQDQRSASERSVQFIVDSPAKSRRPVRDYIPVEDRQDLPSAAIASVLSVGGAQGENGDYLIQLRNSKRLDNEFDATRWYSPGDTVVYKNKHFTALVRTRGNFDAANWDESFVHMPESFGPEGYYKNLSPIVIIDGDVDKDDKETLGVTALPAASIAQIRNAVDYVGARIFLDQVNLGNVSIDPEAESERRKTVNKVTNFHRPSNIRLYSHAFEWAGFQNYSKAVPKYQLDLSATNKFTYYFTNEAGGRVYCSGFNEEGQGVTNTGLQDFETGASISFEQVGNGALSALELAIPDLPLATKDTGLGNEQGQPGENEKGASGIINVASRTQVEKVIVNDYNPIDAGEVNASAAGLGWRAVEVNDLAVVRDYIQAKIDQDKETLKILEDTKSIVYIHKDVIRETNKSLNAESPIPQAVINAFDKNKGVHGGASGVLDSRQIPVINQVAFNNLYQAVHWLNGRSPIGRGRTEIVVIGECDGLARNADDYEERIEFTQTKPVRIKGDTGQTTDKSYSGKRIETTVSTGLLQFKDVTVSVGGTIDNDLEPADEYFMGRFESDIEIENSTLQGRSDKDFMAVLVESQTEAKAILRYNDLEATSIKFDLRAYSAVTDPRVGHTNIRFPRMDILSSVRDVPDGQESVFNELIFKLQTASSDLQRPHQVEIWEGNMRLGGGDGFKQNNKLKFIFDLEGTKATKFRILGPTTDSSYRVVANGDFNSDVLGKGDVTEVQIFTCDSYEKMLRLSQFVDQTQTGTVSETIANAWRSAGVNSTNIQTPLPYSGNGPLLVCGNIYNGTFYETDSCRSPVSQASRTNDLTRQAYFEEL